MADAGDRVKRPWRAALRAELRVLAMDAIALVAIVVLTAPAH
jgi:hypothetical protein